MKTSLIQKLTSALSLAAITTLLCVNASAQTTSWTNPSPGEWNLDSNWDFGAPGTGTNAVINSPAVVTYDQISIYPAFGSLTLGGALTVNTNSFVMNLAGAAAAPVAISSGGVLTVAPTGFLTASNCGPATVSAGGTLLVSGNVLLRPETATTTNGALVISGGAATINSGGNLTIGVAFTNTTSGNSSVFITGGGTLTNNGTMTVSNTGAFTLNSSATGNSNVLMVFNAGSTFTMTNTPGGFALNIGTAQTAPGVMHVNGGTVNLDKLLTIVGTNSRVYVSSGTLNCFGGSRINEIGNDNQQRLFVSGTGVANVGNFSVSRSSSAGGLIVTNGGQANATGVQVGVGIAACFSTVGLGGVLTNTGLFTVSDNTNAAISSDRRSQFLVRGGTVVSTDVNGIILANKGHTNSSVAINNTVIGGVLDVNAGTVIAEKISLIKDSTISNAYARLNLSGSGTIYLGSGGLVGNVGVSRTAFNVALSGGTMAANADWASGAPIVLANTVTFKAASEANVAKNITLSNVLSGTSAVLAKTGAGTVTLLGTNTYTGNTTVSAGTLSLGANGSVASPIVSVATGATLAAASSGAFSGAAQISLSDGSTFDVSGAAGFNLGSGKSITGTGTIVGSLTNLSGSTLSPGNTIGVLTCSNGLTQIGGAANNFDLSAATNDTIEVVGDLTVSGANTINVTAAGGSLPAGTYKLFHYTGAFTGGLGAFTLGTPGYLTNIVAAKTVSLVSPGIRGATNLTWVGNAVLNNWDIAGLTNWLSGASLDSFFQGDTVRFDATGAANPLVNVSVNVNPGPITVDAAANYTFTGLGIIGGTNGVTKTNAGTLTILTTNSYTGATIVGQGTLEVSSLANGGANSGIGAALSAAGNLVFESTTLRYLGGTASTDRGSTLNGNGATVEVTNSATTLTLNGATVGAGALTKTGPGTLILNVANGHTGGTVVSNGTLQINNATSFGPAGYTNNGSRLKFSSGFTASQVVEFNNNCVIDMNGVGADIALRGAWSGTGTVLLTNFSDAARTFTIGGDGNGGGTMSAFTGTLNCGNMTCDVRLNDGAQKNYGSVGAVFDLGTGGVRFVVRNGGVTIDLGALKGGANTKLAGRASGSSGTVNYSVGALNLDTTFDGVITNFNNAAALTKVGTGKLTLTGASTYTGATLINAGTLQVDGALGNTTVTVVGGTLAGHGTIGAAVTVQTGATIAPGSSVGTLTVNSSVQLDSGSTNNMEIDVGNATNDLLGCTSIIYGGTLNVTNLSGSLAAGNSFKLFGPTNEVSYSGAFDGGTNLPPLGFGLAWDTTGLATNGTILVYSTSSINPTPTNLTFTAGGGNLNISWPSDHTGWTLQTQTNSRSVGLKVPTNNWYDVAGSAATNAVTLPISTANPTVFFRLFYVVP